MKQYAVDQAKRILWHILSDVLPIEKVVELIRVERPSVYLLSAAYYEQLQERIKDLEIEVNTFESDAMEHNEYAESMRSANGEE